MDFLKRSQKIAWSIVVILVDSPSPLPIKKSNFSCRGGTFCQALINQK